MRSLQYDPRRAPLSSRATLEKQEPNTLLCEARTLSHGFVQLPKLVLYASNLSRDAKLLYAVLLGYARKKQRCFPGYKRLCADLDASENMVRKYMRELENVHALSQRKRGQGKTNLYTLHDLRTSKIEVQDHHKSAVLEPQESDDNEEAVEEETVEEETDRTICERPVRKATENTENDEKALVGGGPAGSATVIPISPRLPTKHQRRAPARDKPSQAQDASPRNQALAQARAVAGDAIEEQLHGLGGSNPAGGVETILAALVDVQTPLEVISALLEIGESRLKWQQELSHIPNPTGYLIGIMRNLAVEAWLKGWNLARIQAEDEEKHAQAVRSAAHAGSSVLTYEDNAAPLEEEPASEAFASADTELPRAPEPISYLPDGVVVAEAAMRVTWQDRLPDPQGGQLRSVSMLWGFVREAIRGSLNTARKGQLDALTPKWDAARPRTLLLLCETTYGARAAELNLRREIELQLGKLLAHFFDEFQVVYAPGRVQGDEAEEGEDDTRPRDSSDGTA